MKLTQWTATVIANLKAAGFEVSEYQGFPLVNRPESLEETERLLNFSVIGFPADRTIYAEGMLFVPAGSAAAAEQLRQERGA
jgi:hypothetical protein